MIKVVRYSHDLQKQWNNLVPMCKNSTFLHLRSYMDYHSDRFSDESYVVYDDHKPVALFPAHRRPDGDLASHDGLTYGGFLLMSNSHANQNLLYFHALLKFLHENGTRTIFFKQLPTFYCRESADEIDYALHLMDSEVYRADISTCISLHAYYRLPFQKRRLRMIGKALKQRLRIMEADDFEAFWDEILIPNLEERHGVRPVHTKEEIALLSRRNPGFIRQFNVYDGEKILGGCTIFDTSTTAHVQYISANRDGKSCGALDYLFKILIENQFASKAYFDFGIVNEQGGKKINTGLLDWKEGFGARAFVQRFYRIDTAACSRIIEAMS